MEIFNIILLVINKIYEVVYTYYEENLINDSNCLFYYKKGYKTIKYVNTETDCINAGYNYLYGKE